MEKLILCPSGPLVEGSLLFGVIDRRGRVAYHPRGIRVGKELLLQLPVAQEAEQMFRFASPCARDACVHWSGECSLSANLSEFEAHAQDGGALEDLPHCAIRSDCRWYLQNGSTMCGNCQLLARVSGDFEPLS